MCPVASRSLATGGGGHLRVVPGRALSTAAAYTALFLLPEFVLSPTGTLTGLALEAGLICYHLSTQSQGAPFPV